MVYPDVQGVECVGHQAVVHIDVNTVGYSPHLEICPVGVGYVGHQAVVHELGANLDSCGYSPHLVIWPAFLATAGLLLQFFLFLLNARL